MGSVAVGIDKASVLVHAVLTQTKRPMTILKKT
jgi:hypothetical protein